ncbi:MAG: XRE family transcriptional regulator [Alphaproteobacteria bacterium]|nr:MAG: XRE family transcriptional regulator [Alphaproteobacteria bacterium]
MAAKKKTTRAGRTAASPDFALFRDEESPTEGGQIPVLGRRIGGRGGVALAERIEAETAGWRQAARHNAAAIRAGQLLRRARELANLTQAQLAQRVGMPQSKISDLERGIGRYGPTFEVMERVAAVCGRHITLYDPRAAQPAITIGGDRGLLVEE